MLTVRLILFLFGSLSVIFSRAQPNLSWGCGDDKLISLQNKLIPYYQQRHQQFNLQLRQYISLTPKQNNLNLKAAARPATDPQNGTYTIPLVVHVIYPAGEAYGTGTNISYAQIRSQVEALNAAYSRSYPAYNGESHPSYAQNTNIRFCLAQIPSPGSSWASGPGGTEYGVVRYADNTGAYDHEITVASASRILAITHPTGDYFPFEKYLNIWLVRTIDQGDNIMGYAPRPLMSDYPIDGVVMRADIFGDNTTGGNYKLGFNLNRGKVLAHEVGHYFDLYHIFQGGCAGTNGPGAAVDACDINGDYICDTKPCTTQNVSCNSGIYNTCQANYDPGTTANDMINDYMSYADDDCMNTFTLNQAQRMWAILQLQRRNLWQTENLAATGVLGINGCVSPYLSASINSDQQVFCAGTPIHFYNPGAGNTANTYQWKFTGGTTTTGNKDSATVTYNMPGNYKVILTVGDGNNIRSDSLLISVLTCKLDSSLLSMAHWYFGDFCSLDFSSGSPVQTTTALTRNTMHGEAAYPGQLPYVQGTISLSDSSGNLLFYSNGISIWNKSHKKISTSPIFGASDINATTGICYIPWPGKPGKYFIAGVYPNFDESPCGVRFVMVDAITDEVTPFREFAHPSLPKRFSQFLTVVPHCNGTDYWIITKGYGPEDTRFYSFLVTTNGIDVSQPPVISSGFAHPGYGGSGNQLKANRKGDKLILCSPHGYIDIESAVLYDFDSRTGEVRNERIVPNAAGYSNIQSGTAFSPNGDYFYLMRSTNLATNGTPHWLFQYRVSDFKYNVIPTNGFYFGFPFQLGPDNQLYIVNGYNYLARLSDPDVWGGATFNDQFIYLKQPSQDIFAGSSLPAFIDAQFKKPDHPEFSVEAISCTTFRFSSPCFDSYKATWNFGDGSGEEEGHFVTHTFAIPGNFIVTLTLSSYAKVYGSATKKITVLPDTAVITGPDSVCSTNNFATQFFARADSGVNYKWSAVNGTISGPDDLPYVNITWQNSAVDSGEIQLQVSSGPKCIVPATKKIAIIKRSGIAWILQDSICVTAQPLVLKATPEGGIFMGDGISDKVFSAATAGAGPHELTYRYSNGTACTSEVQKIITVTNGISIEWKLQDSICISASPLALRALPAGGIFSGPGINGQFFNPVIAGLGDHRLVYSYGSEDACKSEVQKIIAVKDGCIAPGSKGPLMPNGFTPNGDGINDVFRIPEGVIQTLAEFSVYNRWGEKIFVTRNITKGWNGMVRGIAANPGVYIYFISGTDANGEQVLLRGPVTLVK